MIFDKRPEIIMEIVETLRTAGKAMASNANVRSKDIIAVTREAERLLKKYPGYFQYTILKEDSDRRENTPKKLEDL